jgi:major type 1 subunit fimbrin (pilin)
MNLKPTLLAVGLAVACGGLAIAPAALAADGTVNITGTIITGTCTAAVAGNNGTAVKLPTVQSSVFGGLGSTSSPTPFSISLTNCPTTPSGVQATANFDQTNVDASTGALTTTGGTGIEVQLTDGSGTAINLKTSPAPVSATIASDGTATLGYKAQYYQPSATSIVAGSVTTSVDYTLTYN